MVTRQRKLLAAGLVLVAGLGLAWPLRRTEPLGRNSPHAGLATAADVHVLTQRVDLDVHGTPRLATPPNPATPTASAPSASAHDPFADVPRPIYSTISDGASSTSLSTEPKPAERFHIVHQGDSLDRLAKRYLGDEARALEIFDLNREALDNPHILPIGVELRLPPAAPAKRPP